MRKSASIGSRIRPLVVVLLFFSFVLSSLSITNVYRELTGNSITKKTHSFAKADAQMPFEEKEKEVDKAEDKKENEVFLSYLIRATALLPLVELQAFHSNIDSEQFPDPSSTPLYLSKRTLLI
jgi:hypothetical protein